TDVHVADLGLMPDGAVGRVAHVDAAVVAPAVFDWLEAPLDVKDAVGELLVEQQHLVPGALASTGDDAVLDAPRIDVLELGRRRNGDALPRLQIGAGREILPAVRTRFEDAFGLGRISGADEWEDNE